MSNGNVDGKDWHLHLVYTGQKSRVADSWGSFQIQEAGEYRPGDHSNLDLGTPTIIIEVQAPGAGNQLTEVS